MRLTVRELIDAKEVGVDELEKILRGSTEGELSAVRADLYSLIESVEEARPVEESNEE